jgi:peptidoglycan/LPS O-acetylase OafA/YrhL
MYPTLSVGWTLNYEMFFYSLVAIAIIVGGEKLKLSLAIVAILLISLPVLEKLLHLGIYYSFYLIEFALGMFLYALLNSRFWRFKYVLMLGAALAVLFLSYPVIDRMLVAFLIVLLALSLEKYISPNNMVSKIGLFLGSISFSVYLSHSVFLLMLVYFIGSFKGIDVESLWVVFALSLSLIFTLTLSILSYKLIEVRLSTTIKKGVFS